MSKKRDQLWIIDNFLKEKLEKLEDKEYITIESERSLFPKAVADTVQKLYSCGFDVQDVASSIMQNAKLPKIYKYLKNYDYKEAGLKDLQKLLISENNFLKAAAKAHLYDDSPYKKRDPIANRNLKYAERELAQLDSKYKEKLPFLELYNNVVIAKINDEVSSRKLVNHEAREEIIKDLSLIVPEFHDIESNKKLKNNLKEYLVALSVEKYGNASNSKAIKGIFTSSKLSKLETEVRNTLDPLRGKANLHKTLNEIKKSLEKDINPSNQIITAVPKQKQKKDNSILRS